MYLLPGLRYLWDCGQPIAKDFAWESALCTYIAFVSKVQRWRDETPLTALPSLDGFRIISEHFLELNVGSLRIVPIECPLSKGTSLQDQEGHIEQPKIKKKKENCYFTTACNT